MTLGNKAQTRNDARCLFLRVAKLFCKDVGPDFCNGTNRSRLTGSVATETGIRWGRGHLSYCPWYWLGLTFLPFPFLNGNCTNISLSWVKILCYVVTAQSYCSRDLGSATSNRGFSCGTGWWVRTELLNTEWLKVMISGFSPTFLLWCCNDQDWMTNIHLKPHFDVDRADFHLKANQNGNLLLIWKL